MRNYILGYLCEANSVITFGSTGVRGMKYEGHPLIGSMIPREVRLASERAPGSGSREGGGGGGVDVGITTGTYSNTKATITLRIQKKKKT